MGNNNARFVIVYEVGDYMNNTKILVDRVTGVNYLWHKEYESGGLTPLLDANGKPINSFNK